MTSDSSKRLEAIREFSALGSGFRLSLRDLEIRGAGNLLGPEQHGYLSAVGLDTYIQLLAQEVARQKGTPQAPEPEGPAFELSLSAFLPEDYMPSPTERILTYKRILGSADEELPALKEEIEDRCGPLPPAARRLFELSELRLRAKEAGIDRVVQGKGGLDVFFQAEAPPPEELVKRWLSAPHARVRFLPGPPQGIRLPLPDPEKALEVVAAFMEESKKGN